MTHAYQWWVESVETETGLANDVKIFNFATDAVKFMRQGCAVPGEHYSIVLVYSRGAAMNGSLVREYAPADESGTLPKAFRKSSHEVPAAHRAELEEAFAQV